MLSAAAAIKRLAGQINVVIHALGILLCLPHLFEEGEVVEYVSLGAGNTGRHFDLKTDRRVAEFKFIRWRGGAETIRQNAFFKDFFLLAEARTDKRKHLYVLDMARPLRLMRGGRAIHSVLNGNTALLRRFAEAHGDRYRTVSDYFRDHGGKVAVEDVSRWVLQLAAEGVAFGADEIA